MKVAILQPYFFPYIGYFQLIKAVDKFVFYDDVNYIKSGWVNRNRILLNGSDHYITVPCIKASQNKLIKDVVVDTYDKKYSNILKTIEVAYKKAKYFQDIFPIIQNVFSLNNISISTLCEQSVIKISQYLNIKTEFLKSSLSFPETKGLEKEERLIAICKQIEAEVYINPIGGTELYSKSSFLKESVNLYFLKSSNIQYTQFNNEFIPWLSIIDVLMFNSISEVNNLITNYELV